MFFRNQRKSAQDIPLSEPIDNDGDGNSLTLQDIMADDGDIHELIDLRINSEKVRQFIEKELGAREREIIQMRYGLFGQKPSTQREVAKKLGISRSYVSRLETKVIEKLRRMFVEDGIIIP